MKAELLEKLLDAGFTKSEIIQLARDEPISSEPAAAADPEPAAAVEVIPESVNTEPDDIPEPEAAAETVPEPDNTEKRLAGIEKNIADLIKAVQVGNLKNDSFPNPVESTESLADKSIFEIIRPARKERGA